MAQCEGVWSKWRWNPDDVSWEDMEAQRELVESLIEVSNAMPAGKMVGGVLRFQRGDGYAFYIVTAEKPLTLAWLPFGDGWYIEDALIRGLNREDVLGMIARERALGRIFGKSKHKMKGDPE